MHLVRNGAAYRLTGTFPAEHHGPIRRGRQAACWSCTAECLCEQWGLFRSGYLREYLQRRPPRGVRHRDSLPCCDGCDLAARSGVIRKRTPGAQSAHKPVCATSCCVPGRFDVPDLDHWIGTTRSKRARLVVFAEQTLGDAVSTFNSFVDQILAGTANGAWDPVTLRWRRRS
jgi:hypothetical protein